MIYRDFNRDCFTGVHQESNKIYNYLSMKSIKSNNVLFLEDTLMYNIITLPNIFSISSVHHILLLTIDRLVFIHSLLLTIDRLVSIHSLLLTIDKLVFIHSLRLTIDRLVSLYIHSFLLTIDR